jgi:hypothetical protein
MKRNLHKLMKLHENAFHEISIHNVGFYILYTLQVKAKMVEVVW